LEAELTEQPPGHTALTEAYLEQIRGAFEAYEENGDAFARARLVRDIGKNYAPQLLAEVERLRSENRQLREVLEPMMRLVETLAEVEAAESVRAHLEQAALQTALRAAGKLLDPAEGTG
jgi:hypothetical protein